MSPDILFDNIIVTDDEYIAEKWAEETFEIRKQRIAKDAVSWKKYIHYNAKNTSNYL